MTYAYPFSAIVGQENMKLSMILAAIDPKIGGVLVFGDRGTGKSTAVRALSQLLPLIDVLRAVRLMPHALKMYHRGIVAPWVRSFSGRHPLSIYRWVYPRIA